MKSKNISGMNIAKHRKKAGFTQLELSKRLKGSGTEIDRAGIAKIENGLRNVLDFELLAISKVLKVDLDRLLRGKR